MQKKPKALIIDHGHGNIGSLSNALTQINVEVNIASNYEDYSTKPDAFILPGVGSFGPAMNSMKSKHLDKLVYKLVESGCKGLGICLGMQMLATTSEEDISYTRGLNLISGKIKKLSPKKAPVPHLGWSKTEKTKKKRQKNEYRLNGIFYYAHSYVYKDLSNDSIAATFNHGGKPCTAAISNLSLLGVQFHPEKSQEDGLRFLKDFLTN